MKQCAKIYGVIAIILSLIFLESCGMSLDTRADNSLTMTDIVNYEHQQIVRGTVNDFYKSVSQGSKEYVLKMNVEEVISGKESLKNTLIAISFGSVSETTMKKTEEGIIKSLTKGANCICLISENDEQADIPYYLPNTTDFIFVEDGAGLIFAEDIYKNLTESSSLEDVISMINDNKIPFKKEGIQCIRLYKLEFDHLELSYETKINEFISIFDKDIYQCTSYDDSIDGRNAYYADIIYKDKSENHIFVSSELHTNTGVYRNGNYKAIISKLDELYKDELFKKDNDYK